MANTVNQLKNLSKSQLLNQDYQLLAKAFGSGFIGKSKEQLVNGLLKVREDMSKNFPAAAPMEEIIGKTIAKKSKAVNAEVGIIIPKRKLVKSRENSAIQLA